MLPWRTRKISPRNPVAMTVLDHRSLDEVHIGFPESTSQKVRIKTPFRRNLMPMRGESRCPGFRRSGWPESPSTARIESRYATGRSRGLGMLLPREVKVTRQCQGRHDREDEYQADQQIERAPEAGGNLRRVGLSQVRQTRAPRPTLMPERPRQSTAIIPTCRADHHGAHPQHQVAEHNQGLGCDQRDRRENKLAPENLLTSQRQEPEYPEIATLQREQWKYEPARERG